MNIQHIGKHSPSDKGVVIDLNVGGILYNTLKSTLLGKNLKFYHRNIEEGTNKNALDHMAQQLMAPTPMPITLPTLFDDIFHDIELNETKNPSNHTIHNITHVKNTPLTFMLISSKENEKVIFLDRDGQLFRYILDYMRTGELALPLNFADFSALSNEAKFYRLPHMEMLIANIMDEKTHLLQKLSLAAPSRDEFRMTDAKGGIDLNYRENGYVTLGYRGTFAFGRDGQADVKFRKMTRILVCGRVSLCREIFGDTLNESRDPDRGHYERYSSRFFLKHNFLEQAFDDLQRCGFKCVCACGSSTSSACKVDLGKPSMDNEENKWNHYNEFVFCRP
ncbi:BTB/POZ domain-containing protein KCTD12-like isoform X2 [Gordionus sp. m RMFG-2023]|uniref:BTB/POZ domain-containing protein KCTD12-like isoform X2 n=1 Tax=Gordionus sp. m RMFG-2023 TaxID=3053472 RepID=UPI0031FC3E69